MEKKIHVKLTTTRIIALGFLIGIVIGSFLLSLPIASKPGQSISYVDAVFVATTSICVTGLTPVVTAEQWSLFGQVVILILVQMGGLGVVTFTTLVLSMLGKRITLSNRILIQDAYNLDSISGVVGLTKRIVKGTLLVEACGAVLYSFVFIPEFGWLSGSWKSIFHAVSAFCNAGLDTVSTNSFIIYQTNGLINVTTMLLIIVAGIGFPVWWDVLRVGKEITEKKIVPQNFFRKLTVHSKLAISATAVLLFGGGLLFLLFEYKNPDTIGTMSFGNKLMASLFESVTLRTAGFQSIPQENLTEASSLLALVLMFIGGSPSGTAGGVKTVTVLILILAMAAAIKGENEVQAFHRKITDDFVRRAMAVVGSSAAFLFLSSMLLCFTEEAEFLDILFESVSALATVGITRGLTGNLTTVGKWIVIATMYVGRIGPITMALAFNTKTYKGKKTLAESKVIIG